MPKLSDLMEARAAASGKMRGLLDTADKETRDLTDTEEAVSALEMTETRYRRMLENISDTVTLVGKDGRVLLTTGNLRNHGARPEALAGGRQHRRRPVRGSRDQCER